MKELSVIFLAEALVSLSIGLAATALLEVALWINQGTSMALADRFDITLAVTMLIMLKPGRLRVLLTYLKRSRP